MLRQIEYARRQAVEAYQCAAASIDSALREEWLTAARLWEELVRQYEVLQDMTLAGDGD